MNNNKNETDAKTLTLVVVFLSVFVVLLFGLG